MKFTDILVPIDFSEASIRAAQVAVDLAPPSGSVNLLHVIDADFVLKVEEIGYGDRNTVFERLREVAEGKLTELAHGLQRDGVEVTTMAVVGKPFVEILRIAQELDYDLIVVGSSAGSGSTVERALFGSTAERVLRTGLKPVLSLPIPPQAQQVDEAAAP